MKRNIAMRCTKAQFDSIRDKIKFEDVRQFEFFPYLITDYACSVGVVSNISRPNGRDTYETFDAKIFLEACGVEVGLVKGKVYEVKDSYHDCWCECEFAVNFEGADYFKYGLSLERWDQVREINTIKVGDVYKLEKFHAIVVKVNDKEVVYTGVDFDGIFKENMSCPVPVTVKLVKQ